MVRCLAGGARAATDLSAELGMTPSAVSQSLVRLERMGLIERRPDEFDRRVRRIALSPLGEQMLRERQSLRVDRARTALESLPVGHRRRLIESLDELIQTLGPAISPQSDSLSLAAEIEQTFPPIAAYSFPEPNNR